MPVAPPEALDGCLEALAAGARIVGASGGEVQPDTPHPGLVHAVQVALGGHLVGGRRLRRVGHAAKSLQLCPTLCNPRDGSPPGSPDTGILQARTLEWVAISFSNERTEEHTS